MIYLLLIPLVISLAANYWQHKRYQEGIKEIDEIKKLINGYI